MSLENRKIRVAHLVSHPIQYFVPLYRALTQRPEIELTVYFSSVASLGEHLEPDFGRPVKWDIPLTGGYHYELKGDAETRPLSRKPNWKPNWGILRDLLRRRYDVIWLHGYANGNAWLATVLGRVLGIPVMLRDDQTLLTPRTRLNRIAKKLILPLLFRQVTGLAIGVSNQAFLEHYGTKRNFRVAYCVDNSFFKRQRDRLAHSRPILRQGFGVNDATPIIMFSGKFVDKKKPLLLLEAFRLVRRETKCHLLFVGDGPLRNQLEHQVCIHAIPDVHFAGFLNQSEIAAAYASADIMVLPSAYQETWGLVVNEAMNFGLPIIVSDRVGSAADLVKEGENGFVFRSGDVNDLVAALRRLVLCEEFRASCGRQSLEIISSYSIDAVCEQAVQSLLSVTGRNLGEPSTAVRNVERYSCK
jgi:glycosyltransferase involved in cell wall biosynthesis